MSGHGGLTAPALNTPTSIAGITSMLTQQSSESNASPIKPKAFINVIFFDACPDKRSGFGKQFKARGLRSICESILTDAMYELPSSKVKTFTLTKEYAERKFQVSKLSLLKVA